MAPYAPGGAGREKDVVVVPLIEPGKGDPKQVRREEEEEVGFFKFYGGTYHHPFEIERSAIVAVSCLPFLLLSILFFANGWYFHGVQYLAQTWISFQADCWNPRSELYLCLDRISATGVILFCPVRVLVLPIAGLICKVQVFTLLSTSVAFVFWSMRSQCQREYVVRHSLWHLVGSLSLWYYADRVIYHKTYDTWWPWDEAWWHFGPKSGG